MSDEKSSGGEFINVAETKMYGTKAVIKADIAPYNSKVGINRLINRCCWRYCNGEQYHGNDRLPAANIAAGVFEQKKREKRETKIWIYFGLFWSSWSSEFMSVSLLVTRYTRI